MSKKDNKNKWQWYYHFHIWQIVPDVFKFGLKGAWQKQDKASKIFIIIFLVFILFQILGVLERGLISRYSPLCLKDKS